MGTNGLRSNNRDCFDSVSRVFFITILTFKMRLLVRTVSEDCGFDDFIGECTTNYVVINSLMFYFPYSLRICNSPNVLVS